MNVMIMRVSAYLEYGVFDRETTVYTLIRCSLKLFGCDIMYQTLQTLHYSLFVPFMKKIVNYRKEQILSRLICIACHFG